MIFSAVWSIASPRRRRWKRWLSISICLVVRQCTLAKIFSRLTTNFNLFLKTFCYVFSSFARSEISFLPLPSVYMQQSTHKYFPPWNIFLRQILSSFSLYFLDQKNLRFLLNFFSNSMCSILHSLEQKAFTFVLLLVFFPAQYHELAWLLGFDFSLLSGCC